MSRDLFPAGPRDGARGTERESGSERSLGPDTFSRRPCEIPAPCTTVGERGQPSADQRRSDSSRFYHDRGRAYRLSDSERHTLEEVGKFRLIAVRDLEQHGYQGNRKQIETDIRRLCRQGLLRDQTLPVSRRKTIRILTLTKSAHHLLKHARFFPEGQAVYHGLRRLREAKHDADLYCAYQREAARLERAGGRPLRVRLDYELEKNLNRDLASLGRDAQNQQRKQEIAQKHRLQLVDGRIRIPDLRIEYGSPDGELHHVDLELATRDYGPRALAVKVAAGFSLYSRAEDAPRLRRILDERELTAAILTL